jgi:hypothetical protein
MTEKAQGTEGTCTADRCTGNTIRIALGTQANNSFPEALAAAQFNGNRITRRGWNAGGQYVMVQHPDKRSMLSTAYMVIKNSNNEFVPWVPSQGDLFARDWAIIPIQPL